MDERDRSRLAAIGPFSVIADQEGQLVVVWENLPELASPLGPVTLEFRAERLGLLGPASPHGTMFDLWDAWKARHAEYVAELQLAVELEQEAAAVTGALADFVTAARVVIHQIEDGPSCCDDSTTVAIALRGCPPRVVRARVNARLRRLDFD